VNNRLEDLMNKIIGSIFVIFAVLAIGSYRIHAAEPDYKKLYEEQQKRNDTLERRLAILEEQLGAKPYVEQESLPEATLNFLQKTEISGYVAASYFYNFNKPESRENTGRGFDVRHNEFQANKFVLKLEQPVNPNPFDWSAGYAAQVIFGQDAEFTQASGLSLGDHGDLLQAYLEVNVPVGNGLKIIFGKHATPIGYELTETEQNYNWSAGNQWTFLEPFTHTGIQLSYQINEKWDAQLLVNNGWDNVRDNNNSLSFMGRVGFAPSDKTSYSFIAFGGPEQDGNDGAWRRGVHMVADHWFTRQFNGVIQLDYGKEDEADPNGNDAEWFGAGLWLAYLPTEKWSVAVRGDWVKDGDGARTSGAPALAPFSNHKGQELYSLTLTLNIKPISELRIAPEVRWDRSSRDNAFDGHKDQVTVGVGAAYFY
jgi:hypothetical protein